MRIEWLDDDMTRASVTRGLIRKMCTTVHLSPKPLSYDQDNKVWKYDASGREVEYDARETLDSARLREQRRREHELDWRPVQPVPPAKLVRR